MAQPWLFITIDDRHGVALVRGDDAKRVTGLLAPAGSPSRWSSYGRGWVVPASVVDDILAYGSFHRCGFSVISHRRVTAA